eukprot:6208801-Pleurochrysis_carterae.AAC.2
MPHPRETQGKGHTSAWRSWKATASSVARAMCACRRSSERRAAAEHSGHGCRQVETKPSGQRAAQLKSRDDEAKDCTAPSRDVLR